MRRYSIEQRSRVTHEMAESGIPERIEGEHPTVHLYMDESGNGGAPALPLIVGALAVDNYSHEIEVEVRRLHRELSARRDLRGTKYFEEFQRVGFHAKNDPPEIAGPFLKLMSELPGYRVSMAMTDRTTMARLAEVEQIKKLYDVVVSDNLLRYVGYGEVVCHIEENQALRGLRRELPERAQVEAHDKAGPSAVLPPLYVEMVAKSTIMSMAILDYTMMAVKRWADSRFEQDISKYPYRQFVGVQDRISVLYSLENGLILNRKTPLHGQSR